MKLAIKQAEQAKAEAAAVKRAAAIASRQADLPAYPKECETKERSGVKGSDKADVALKKSDAALARYADKQEQCAGWYKNVRAVHRRGTRSGGIQ